VHNASTTASAKNPVLTRQDAIFLEQANLLAVALHSSVLGTFLGIFFLILMMWTAIDTTILISWSITLAIISFARSAHARWYHKVRPTLANIRKWSYQFAALSFTAALTWGSAAIFLFPATDPIRQMMLAFVLSVACAVAVSTLSPIRYIIVTFIILILAPLAIRFMVVGDTYTSTLMGIIVAVTIPLLIVNALRMNRVTVSNISLRIDAVAQENKLRDSQQRLSMHMRRTPLAVIEWNNNLDITEWNDAAQKIFGYSRKEVLGKNGIQLLVPAYLHDRVSNIRDQLQQNDGGLYSVNENITKDGRTILCEWFNTPLVDENGRVIGIASLAQDVTERVRIDQMKRDFVSIVSHELRTPLTAIRGALGLILGGATGKAPEKMNDLIKIADDNTQRLLHIINDILDIDKIESGVLEYHFSNVPVMLLVDKAVTNNSSYAQQYDVKLLITKRLEACINADNNRIMQVLDNLVSNAIKFSPKGGEVELSVTRHDSNIRISVRDYGPGIPTDFQDKLFDKFTQADFSNTRGASGAGLGLNIAKAVIEHHKGQIGFHTEQNQGTTFYFDLPEMSHCEYPDETRK
jgi:PAS domain S-box-containing protein